MPTREEILAEPAGRQLDEWIAVHVMGWKNISQEFVRGVDIPGTVFDFGDDPQGKRQMVPDFSTSWEGAGLVLEKMHGRGDCVSLGYQQGILDDLEKFGWLCEFRRFGVFAVAESAPEAICKAALLAVIL